MTVWLKQSTAATVKVGPFLDSGDGATAETALTIQKADVRLSKNGGNMAAASADQGASDVGAAHDELGYYDISLDTTDTGTLGSLRVMISESGALPVWQDFMVVPANVYDSLIGGSDYLNAEVAAMAADTVTASALATDAVTEIQSGLAAAADLATVAGYLDTEIAAIKAKTDNLPASPASTGDVTGLLTTAMTESYSTDGGTVTIAQALYELLARDQEIEISGTTMILKKRDGTTTALTLTLNSATAPTIITRSA
jgi:hypothetical protein